MARSKGKGRRRKKPGRRRRRLPKATDVQEQLASIDRAVRLSKGNQTRRAIDILKSLRAQRPEAAAVHGYLGGMLMAAGEYRDAVESFRTAVALSPKSELASLGLFHSLFNMGWTDEAFAEMKRFLSLAESKEYQQLLAELDRAAPTRQAKVRISA